jgi:hypothetical protein
MSFAKLAAACGLVAVALIVSACGIQAKPVAGTVHLNRVAGNHDYVSDPRTRYLSCLHHDHFKVTKFDLGRQKFRSLQINSKPSGPTIVFQATPGLAEGDQILGQDAGAEVIGSAQVYPNHATNKLMKKVETCLTIKVFG